MEELIVEELDDNPDLGSPKIPKAGHTYDCLLAVDAFGSVWFLRAPAEIVNLCKEVCENGAEFWGVNTKRRTLHHSL